LAEEDAYQFSCATLPHPSAQAACLSGVNRPNKRARHLARVSKCDHHWVDRSSSMHVYLMGTDTFDNAIRKVKFTTAPPKHGLGVCVVTEE
jgi:hypothetical protein